jgi:hypothetical protein
MAILKNEEFLNHVLIQAPEAEPYYPQYQNHDSSGVGCLIKDFFLFVYSSPCEEPSSSYTDLFLLLLFHCLKQEPGSLGATLPNA